MLGVGEVVWVKYRGMGACEMTAWVSPSAIFMWTNANTAKFSQQTRCRKQKQQQGDGLSAQQPVHLSQEIHDEEGCCVHCRVHDYTRSFGPSCAEEVQGVKVHASVRNSDVDWHCSPSCAKVAAELKGVEGKRGEIPDGTPFSMQLAQYNENHRGSRQSIAAALKVRPSLPSLPLPPSSSPIPNCSFRLPSAIPCFSPARVPSPLSTATNSLQSHGSMSCLRSCSWGRGWERGLEGMGWGRLWERPREGLGLGERLGESANGTVREIERRNRRHRVGEQ
ncbi:unnamed protein product [Closterium sp. NIES-65]|nr:unnamed protein product [Closterium sp. NIES-65]